MQKLIVETAVSSRMKEAEDKAKEMFKDLKEKGKAVPPNFRAITYSTGVRFGDIEEWKFAWKMYNSTLVPSEKTLWMRAIAASDNPNYLQQ